MALIVKCEAVQFVHRMDPAFRAENARPTADPDWFLAFGQPADCTHFSVRPLNVHEYRSVEELDGAEQRAAACEHGLEAIDGVTVTGSLAMGWDIAVANLILSLSAGPLLAGQRPTSAASPPATTENASPEATAVSSAGGESQG